MAHGTLLKLFLPLLLMLCSEVCSDVTLNFNNLCAQTIWRGSKPYISVSAGQPNLDPGVVSTLTLSDPWSGTIWPRTQCRINGSSYYFACETGDCLTGDLTCPASPVHPVTELNFKINNSVVSYGVSLLHGQNVLVRIKPNGGTLVGGGSGPCPMVECNNDLRSVCPSYLVTYNQSSQYVGCKNLCDFMLDPKYCCDGVACRPDVHMKDYKQLCPDAVTFLGDEPPPYQCKGADSFDITFCPN